MTSRYLIDLENRKSKIIHVYRNGDKYNRAALVLLRPIEQQKLERIFKAIEEKVTLPYNKPIRKIYTVDGTEIEDPIFVKDQEYYVAGSSDAFISTEYGSIYKWTVIGPVKWSKFDGFLYEPRANDDLQFGQKSLSQWKNNSQSTRGLSKMTKSMSAYPSDQKGARNSKMMTLSLEQSKRPISEPADDRKTVKKHADNENNYFRPLDDKESEDDISETSPKIMATENHRSMDQFLNDSLKMYQLTDRDMVETATPNADVVDSTHDQYKEDISNLNEDNNIKEVTNKEPECLTNIDENEIHSDGAQNLNDTCVDDINLNVKEKFLDQESDNEEEHEEKEITETASDNAIDKLEKKEDEIDLLKNNDSESLQESEHGEDHRLESSSEFNSDRLLNESLKDDAQNLLNDDDKSLKDFEYKENQDDENHNKEKHHSVSDEDELIDQNSEINEQNLSIQNNEMDNKNPVFEDEYNIHYEVDKQADNIPVEMESSDFTSEIKINEMEMDEKIIKTDNSKEFEKKDSEELVLNDDMFTPANGDNVRESKSFSEEENSSEHDNINRVTDSDDGKWGINKSQDDNSSLVKKSKEMIKDHDKIEIEFDPKAEEEEDVLTRKTDSDVESEEEIENKDKKIEKEVDSFADEKITKTDSEKDDKIENVAEKTLKEKDQFDSEHEIETEESDHEIQSLDEFEKDELKFKEKEEMMKHLPDDYFQKTESDKEDSEDLKLSETDSIKNESVCENDKLNTSTINPVDHSDYEEEETKDVNEDKHKIDLSDNDNYSDEVSEPDSEKKDFSEHKAASEKDSDEDKKPYNKLDTFPTEVDDISSPREQYNRIDMKLEEPDNSINKMNISSNNVSGDEEDHLSKEDADNSTHSKSNDSVEENAAKVIQKNFRGHLVRKELTLHPHDIDAYDSEGEQNRSYAEQDSDDDENDQEVNFSLVKDTSNDLITDEIMDEHSQIDNNDPDDKFLVNFKP